MKKALILFLALGLVAVGAFADDGKVSFSVSGSADVAWGIDLNDMVNGWQNNSSAGISITFVDEQTKEKGGEGVYGYIKVKGLKSTGFASASGSVEAKIVADPVYIKFAGKPEDAAGYASPITVVTAISDVAAALSSSVSGGIIAGLNSGEANVFCLSDADWTAATQGNYTTGVFGKLAFAPVTVEYDVVADFIAASMEIGFGAKVGLALADVVNGLDITLAFDGLLAGAAFDYDARADVKLSFSAADGDGNKSNFALGFYYGDDMTLSATVTELDGDNGVVPGVGASLGFKINLDYANEWALTESANFANADMKIYESFGYDSAGVIPLTVGIDLKTLVQNITVGLKYVSTDLAGGDLGVVTAKASISL